MIKKSFLYGIIVSACMGALLIFNSCNKENNIQNKDTKNTNATLILNEEDAKLKNNLLETSKLLTSLSINNDIHNELKGIGINYDIADSLFSLKAIITDTVLKSNSSSFKNLKRKILEIKELKKIDDLNVDELLLSIELYDYLIWMPYPLEWYPINKQFLTIVSHPIDNEEQNIGYRYNNGLIEEVLVNDEYTDEYPVLIIAPKKLVEFEKSNFENDNYLKNNSIMQVRLGEFMSRSKFGTGLFKNNVSFQLLRGQGELNENGKTITTSWPTSIGFNVSKKHIKSASKGWTQYKNGGWVSINVLWDYNWLSQKTEQALVLVCTSGSNKSTTVKSKVSVDAKGNISSSTNVDTEVKVNGNVVGHMTIDRSGFLKMNKNHYDMKNGWAVHSVHSDVKFTLPHSLN